MCISSFWCVSHRISSSPLTHNTYIVHRLQRPTAKKRQRQTERQKHRVYTADLHSAGRDRDRQRSKRNDTYIEYTPQRTTPQGPMRVMFLCKVALGLITPSLLPSLPLLLPPSLTPFSPSLSSRVRRAGGALCCIHFRLCCCVRVFVLLCFICFCHSQASAGE